MFERITTGLLDRIKKYYETYPDEAFKNLAGKSTREEPAEPAESDELAEPAESDELAEPLKTEQEICDEIDNLKKAINKYLGLDLSGSYEYGKGTISFLGRINSEYQDEYQFVGPAIKFRVLPKVPDRFKPVICFHSVNPAFKSFKISAGSTNNDGELKVIESTITYDQWCSLEDLSVHSEGWKQEWTDWAVAYLEGLDK